MKVIISNGRRVGNIRVLAKWTQLPPSDTCEWAQTSRVHATFSYRYHACTHRTVYSVWLHRQFNFVVHKDWLSVSISKKSVWLFRSSVYPVDGINYLSCNLDNPWGCLHSLSDRQDCQSGCLHCPSAVRIVFFAIQTITLAIRTVSFSVWTSNLHFLSGCLDRQFFWLYKLIDFSVTISRRLKKLSHHIRVNIP